MKKFIKLQFFCFTIIISLIGNSFGSLVPYTISGWSYDNYSTDPTNFAGTCMVSDDAEMSQIDFGEVLPDFFWFNLSECNISFVNGTEIISDGQGDLVFRIIDGLSWNAPTVFESQFIINDLIYDEPCNEVGLWSDWNQNGIPVLPQRFSYRFYLDRAYGEILLSRNVPAPLPSNVPEPSVFYFFALGFISLALSSGMERFSKRLRQ